MIDINRFRRKIFNESQLIRLKKKEYWSPLMELQLNVHFDADRSYIRQSCLTVTATAMAVAFAGRPIEPIPNLDSRTGTEATSFEAS